MKIGIVGAGITGLGAAVLLQENGHDVTLYEKESWLGGHAHTVEIDAKNKHNNSTKRVAVDTGFIVYNELNYPNLVGLFDWLNVPTQESDMSFAYGRDGGKFEYGTYSVPEIFGQKRNIVSPKFWRMLLDVLKFYKTTRALSVDEIDPEMTLGQHIEQGNYSRIFIDDHLMPMVTAIWSTPLEDAPAFPLLSFVRFWQNHKLLQVKDRPEWRTVTEGSQSYVKLVSERLKNIKRVGVAAVYKDGKDTCIRDANGETATYDQVIMACHTDTTLDLLQDITQEEQSILQDIRYQPNRVLLHGDPSLMPKREKVWASWNVLVEPSKPAVLSYWMNRLQDIDTDYPLFVTLNPTHDPKPEFTYGEWQYDHPQFDLPALRAQEKVNTINGKRGIWFAGAWRHYGFHEDGLKSAVEIVMQLGGKLPWKP